jgi:hypothetical protein
MANTIKLAETEVYVQVAPNVAEKYLSVTDELAQLGVKVVGVKVGDEEVLPEELLPVGAFLDAVKTTWLAYSILKEAKNQWPAIRKVLVNAGLSNSEIITLGLSQYTRKKPHKKKQRSKKSAR